VRDLFDHVACGAALLASVKELRTWHAHNPSDTHPSSSASFSMEGPCSQGGAFSQCMAAWHFH